MDGDFTQPPTGPKIGPTKQFDELSADKQAELGDMKELAQSSVFRPAELPKELVEQEATSLSAPSTTLDKTPEEIAEEFAALKTVIAEEEPEAPDPLEEDAVPTDEDKQDFMRAVLGNKAYTKEYSLFGGTIKLTLHDLTTEHEELMFAALAKQEGITTQAEWEVAHDRARLALHLDTLTGGDVTGEPLSDFDDVDKFPQTVASRIDGLFAQSVVYRAAMYTVRVFQLHLEMLLGSVLRPDFWTAGGQDSQSEPTTPA